VNVRYLLTGATGFLGPYLVKRLLSDGHECRCLVRTSSRCGHLQQPGVETVCGDITRPDTLAGIADGMDALIHMATLGHMNNFTFTEEMFEAINVQGTKNIMNEAKRAGVGRIVHCSTVAAMGICPEVPASEDTPCRPHHPYGRSKRQAEKWVLGMASENALPAAIVRFSMVYGPGDGRDILKLTRMAKKGLFPKVGNRPKLTPLIHAEDAVDGLVRAVEKGRPGEIYLITNGQSEPFDRIADIIRNALGVRRPRIYLPQWAALAAASMIETAFSLVGKTPPVTRKNMESTLADRVFAIDKAKRELGFSPGIDPETGLRETIDWYREKGWV
jgi:dihydroflavonol-4-reductase